MLSLATDSTANQLLDYLASDGHGDDWTRYAQLGEWESLFNFRAERNFCGAVARILAERGLAELRRSGRGMQLRLTAKGIDLANERNRESDDVQLLPIEWPETMTMPG